MQSPSVSPSGSPEECPCQEPENPGGGGGPSLPPSSPGASWPSQTEGKSTPPGWIGLIPLRTLPRRPPRLPVGQGTVLS